MRKLLSFLGRVVVSVFLVLLSGCFAVNFTGVIAVAFKIEETDAIVYGVTGLLSVILLIMYWSCFLNLDTLVGIKRVRYTAVCLFGGIVICGALYMGLLKDVLQTMLFLMVCLWILLAILLKLLKNIEYRLTVTEKSAEGTTEK